jgi:glycosyltransferase involved in cell wall biosynthesis
MRILVHDYLAYPFVVELARELAERGHDVQLLHGGGVRSARGATTPTNERLTIAPVNLHEPLKTRAGLGRLQQERRYGRALAQQIRDYRPDVVLSVPSSLDGQKSAMEAARDTGAGFVFWLQDIYSEAIGRLLARRIPGGGRIAAWRFAGLEGRLLREADAVIAISEDFRPRLAAWDVKNGRIHIQPNWAPLEEVRPGPKDNAWAREHGLADATVLLYAGTLGRKHDPGLLAALADGIPEASVVAVAEGTGVERLRDTPVRLMPLQPAERLAEVLATADVLVALLEPDAGVFSVPSKVLTYLTAGRPILAAIPAANQAARTIGNAGAGRLVEPGDPRAFVAAARELLVANGVGESGRAYAERAFAIGPIADRFERVLEVAVGMKPLA